MKKIVLIVMMLISHVNFACQSPSSHEIETRSCDAYNPFREGLMVERIFDSPRHFFNYYEEVKPEILQFLGPEITNFYHNYPESTIASVVHRYMYAMTMRLMLKREGSRKIEIVHFSIPAHYQELTQILNAAVTIGYTKDRDQLHHELQNYFEIVRQHCRNQEKIRPGHLCVNNNSERTAHEKNAHYSPC